MCVINPTAYSQQSLSSTSVHDDQSLAETLSPNGAVTSQSQDVGAEGRDQAELSQGCVFLCSCL